MRIPDIQKDSEFEVIAWLERQDDKYENEGFADVDDETYDNFRRRAQLTYPANKYFTGVGAQVRGNKIKLAFPMNGLQQLYGQEVQTTVHAMGCSNEQMVISDKLDGTSVQIVYDVNGDLQISYSRGDGLFAADITRHMRKLKTLPQKIPATGATIAIRAENIVPINKWDTLLNLTKDRKVPYVNRRGAAAGIMNGSTNKDEVYDCVDCVAYTIIGSPLSKVQQLELLQSYGFMVADYTVTVGSNITDTFLTNEVNRVRDKKVYDLDGIVVNRDIDASNSLAFKFKVAAEDNDVIAVCKDVVYGLSKDGHLNPRVMIHPTVICGVTVTYTNGFNAKFIKDNNIGPGAKLRMTRSGDVSPYIIAVVEGTQARLPDPKQFGEWEWNATGVNAVVKSLEDNRDAIISKLTSSFTKLKIDHLKRGNIEKLYDAGFTTIDSIINMDVVDWYTTIGETGYKIEESITERLTNIYWPELVGSLELSRGIGRKTMTKLYNAFKGNVGLMFDVDAISEVQDFEFTTATAIVRGMPKALDILDKISSRVTLRLYDANSAPSGVKMANQVVVFTGIRSDELENKIIAEGGTIGSGVSSSTTIVVAKDVNSNSGKVKKARTINAEARCEKVKIIGVNALELMLL